MHPLFSTQTLLCLMFPFYLMIYLKSALLWTPVPRIVL